MSKIAELAARWNACGIERGDTVLLHSSARRTLNDHNIGPHELLRSFREALGEEGTLILPTFTFRCAHGEPFDQRNTESEMGLLGRTACNLGHFWRSRHPVYSVCAWGRLARDVAATSATQAFGENTVFELLLGVDGKIAVLDLDDQSSMTFYHHIEYVVGVSYRATKSFISGEQAFRLFVHGDGAETHVNPMGEKLWAAGLYKGDRPHIDSGLRTIRARDMFDVVARVIRDGRAEGLLYRRVTK